MNTKELLRILKEGGNPTGLAPMDSPEEKPPSKDEMNAKHQKIAKMLDAYYEERKRSEARLNKGKTFQRVKPLPESEVPVNATGDGQALSTTPPGNSGAQKLFQALKMIRRKKPTLTTSLNMTERELSALEKKKRNKKHRIKSPRAGWRNRGLVYRDQD